MLLIKKGESIKMDNNQNNKNNSRNNSNGRNNNIQRRNTQRNNRNNYNEELEMLLELGSEFGNYTRENMINDLMRLYGGR